MGSKLAPFFYKEQKMSFLDKNTRKQGNSFTFGVTTPIGLFFLLIFSPFFHIKPDQIPDIVTIICSLSGSIGTILIFYYGFPSFLYLSKKQQTKFLPVHKRPPKNPANWALFGLGLIAGSFLISLITSSFHLLCN